MGLKKLLPAKELQQPAITETVAWRFFDRLLVQMLGVREILCPVSILLAFEELAEIAIAICEIWFKYDRAAEIVFRLLSFLCLGQPHFADRTKDARILPRQRLSARKQFFCGSLVIEV